MTEELTAYLQTLAQVSLTEEEKTAVSADLTALLSYMALLDEIAPDTEVATLDCHLSGLQNVLREDVVRPSLSQEEALANALSEDGFFVVPQTVEEG